MDDFLKQLWAVLIPILVTGIATLVGLAIQQLTVWLKAKAKSEKMDAAITQVGEMAQATVAQLEKEMRPALSDYKLTKTEGQQIKQVAINSIKEQAPKAIAVIAEGTKAEVDVYLGGKVEQAVQVMKTAQECK